MLVMLLMLTVWRVTRLLVVDQFPPIRLLREAIIRSFGVVNEAGQIVAGRPAGMAVATAAGTVAAAVTATLVGLFSDTTAVWAWLPGPIVGLLLAVALGLPGVTHALAYLWTCQWCMGVWVAGGVVALADWRLSVPWPWLVAAAGAGLAGLLAWVEAEHEQRYELRRLQIERNQP